MADFDLLERGKGSDVVLFYFMQGSTTSVNPSLMVGGHQESLSLRVIKTDALGRLLVSQATQQFDIVNSVLPDTVIQLLTGAPIFRRVTFYAKNANALVSFRKQDNTVTAEISVVPNLPLTIEGIFVAALGRNEAPAVISTLQVVVNYDPLAGQL